MYNDFEQINHFWLPVQNVDGSVKMQEYYANFQQAGDTDSCYMGVPDVLQGIEDIDEFTDICDDIAAITNEGFNDFCKMAFNMPDSRKGSVAADREAISDKSLFLTKKRYIMHLVNMEGEKVDKLKIMGVEIIKSDTSAAVKKLLMDLVNFILDGKDMDFVLNEVSNMKSWFYEQSYRDVCIPASCKTFLAAQKTVEATGSMKGLHYSARAALFYNTQCQTNDVQVRAGDKIGIVYIKHPDSKYIGFPVDADFLPDWMDDIIIDYATMWDKAYKKLTNYLESMGWDIASRKKEVKKSLFGFN